MTSEEGHESSGIVLPPLTPLRPCYCVVGSKSVQSVGTGSGKRRFTTIISYGLDGRVLPAMIIFKKLKNVPKGLNLPDNVRVCVAWGGSMNGHVMDQYIAEVCTRHLSGIENYLTTTRSQYISLSNLYLSSSMCSDSRLHRFHYQPTPSDSDPPSPSVCVVGQRFFHSKLIPCSDSLSW